MIIPDSIRSPADHARARAHFQARLRQFRERKRAAKRNNKIILEVFCGVFAGILILGTTVTISRGAAYKVYVDYHYSLQPFSASSER